MRIFPAALEIGDTEGFLPEKDIFGRAGLGGGLANLVGALSEPTVLAVDGQWGSGKTTFLKMWAGLLRQQGFPVIYFDAFENDYSEDAFTALAAEIIGLIDAEKKSGEPKARAFLSKALGAGKVLARSALKIGVKAATMGALAASDLEDLADAVSSEAEELADKHIGELLTKQTERRNTLQSFREALCELPSILAPLEGEMNDGSGISKARPLIFIIDELDRCKPVFALEMLERIKHFFSVPDVHFVLGTHMGQLRTSVQAAYGANIDAHTYLQKFIHLTFSLVDTARHADKLNSTVYINQLKARLDFSSADRDLIDPAMIFIGAVARSRALSLRTIERIMSAFALAVAFTTPTDFRPSPIIAGLCVLRALEPELYNKAKRGVLRYDEVESVFGFEATGDDGRSLFSDWSVKFWRYSIDPDAPQDVIEHFDQGQLWRYNFGSRYEIVPVVANDIIDLLTATA